jgi:TRAP-type C4-dicarboxylate transport system substrate-binding protein
MPATLRRDKSLLHFTALFLGAWLAFSPFSAQAEKSWVLKFATLAPAGSSWMNLLEEWADEVNTKSNGRLVFKMYPGGVQGDEPDVIKKIRFGQLHGGAFTGYGIGKIYSPTRVLELPFLFNNIGEIDYVRKQLMPEIEQGYRDNGYELLGWMEIGFIYFFSTKPIYDFRDLGTHRIWQWQGDPLGQAFFDASGISPVPLSIIDVYTSLSTGLIDTVYAPPLGAIALQWFTKTKYITNVPMANGIGSLVVSSRFYQDLPQDLQKILKSTGTVIGERLVTTSRKDNAASLDVLKKKGLVFTISTEDLDSEYIADINRKASNSLMKSGYIPKRVIRQVNDWLHEYRSSHDAAPADAAL